MARRVGALPGQGLDGCAVPGGGPHPLGSSTVRLPLLPVQGPKQSDTHRFCHDALCLIGTTLKVGQGGFLDLAQSAEPNRLAHQFASTDLTCIIPEPPWRA